jgi:hypothetical protein
MGKTVIAMAVCIYFFFPASVLICEQMYNAVPKYNPDSIQHPKILDIELGDSSSLMKPFFGPGAYLKECEGKDPISYVICLVLELVNWILQLIWSLLKMFGFIVAAMAPGAIPLSIPAFMVTQQLNNAVMGDLMIIIADYIPHVMSYAVPIILSPIIIAVICISAMRAISPAIGGEVQILGVSELI